MTLQRLLISLFALGLAAGPVMAETELLNPSKDAMLVERLNQQDLASGVATTVCVGTVGDIFPNRFRRGIFQFDIAGVIPEGSTIDSVTLGLFETRPALGSSGLSPIFSLHKVTAPWTEGPANQLCRGANAATNDVTWHHRTFPSISWAAVGGDFDPVVSAALAVDGVAGVKIWGSSAQMVADVQDWLDNPSNNAGWIMIGEEELTTDARVFASSENLSAPPVLTVHYSASTVAVGDQPPGSLVKLAPMVPNPSRGPGSINFTLSNAGRARISVHDIEGREVAMIANRAFDAGRHAVWFTGRSNQGSRLGSGIYVVRLEFADQVLTRKFVVTR